MGRELAISYGRSVRPAGQPNDGVSAVVKTPQFAAGRNIEATQPVFEPNAFVAHCSATKKNGEPCQGRPLEGLAVCVFHRETE